MLHRTAFGRKIYMVGGNPRAAELVGINVNRVTFSCYVLSSILAALGGLVLVGYVGSVDNWVGRGYELNSIIATVMGGVSLGGGRGTVFGALVGAFVLTEIFNISPPSGFPRAVSVGGEGRRNTSGGSRLSGGLSVALSVNQSAALSSPRELISTTPTPIERSVGFAQHCDEPDFNVLLQEVKASRPEAGKNWRLQVLVEFFARSPVLVKDKQVRIVVADVEMIVDARWLRTRRLDEAVKNLEQFVAFFWLGVKIGDQGASWFHIVLPDENSSALIAARRGTTPPASSARKWQ